MKIGEYEVVRQLGKGGMSEVYEVENTRLGSRHALKLFTYPKDDPGVRARFETEGRLLARLDHPRIVKVTDIGTAAEDRPYFIMELVEDPEGRIRTFADIMDGEADEETIGRWYDDIRDGLAYIHAKGIVHRDLKLQNILIGADGHAVITDFGISRIFDPKGGDDTVVDPVQTILRVKNGQSLVMGSLGYMAPELEMGMAATPKSDWFALGVIVYKLLTGTWCDARTDIAGMLETYDPVWGKIVPRLLHANPAGRECLSYADEKEAMRNREEALWEERWLAEKSRGHTARHIARYVGGLAVALLVGLAWLGHEFSSQKRIWRLRCGSEESRPPVPSFDDLFKVPAEARAEDQTDQDGNVTVYSRPSFEAARVDALILTQPTLSRLASGDITIEKAMSVFERYYDQLDEDSQTSPFDNLKFGDADWMQFGDNGPLRVLFDRALEKLRTASEQ